MRDASGLSGEVCRCTAFHSLPTRLKTSVMRPEAVSGSDRKSTRLNSSHITSSYAVFCLIPPAPTPPLFPYTTLFRSAGPSLPLEVLTLRRWLCRRHLLRRRDARCVRLVGRGVQMHGLPLVAHAFEDERHAT